MVRSFLKRMWYNACRGLLDQAVARRGAGVGITYHRFEETRGADPVPGMAITPEDFRAQIRFLKTLGPFVRVEDLIFARGPAPRFCLTFDDGYRDNALRLPGLLDELGVPCCVYVTAGFVAGTVRRLPHDEAAGFEAPAMTASELRTLSRHPLVTIGCHTFRHPRLHVYDPKTWREEVVVAKKWIEDTIGREVRHFAFPYGQPGDIAWPYVASFFENTGLVTVASNFGGWNDMPNRDHHPLTRPTLWHVRRAPAIASVDAAILRGWFLGLSNLEEVRRPLGWLAQRPQAGPRRTPAGARGR